MSKHVDLRVHRRSNYTEYSDLTGWIAPHVPNASPCIPASLCAMCQRVCVCVCGSSCSFVIRCCSLSVVSLGISGCLTAWRFRTRAANTQWPRKQQTQRSPKSQIPEGTAKWSNCCVQGRCRTMTMTLRDCPLSVWNLAKCSEAFSTPNCMWSHLMLFDCIWSHNLIKYDDNIL